MYFKSFHVKNNDYFYATKTRIRLLFILLFFIIIIITAQCSYTMQIRYFTIWLNGFYVSSWITLPVLCCIRFKWFLTLRYRYKKKYICSVTHLWNDPGWIIMHNIIMQQLFENMWLWLFVDSPIRCLIEWFFKKYSR